MNIAKILAAGGQGQGRGQPGRFRFAVYSAVMGLWQFQGSLTFTYGCKAAETFGGIKQQSIRRTEGSEVLPGGEEQGAAGRQGSYSSSPMACGRGTQQATQSQLVQKH